MNPELIEPRWPAPPGIRAVSTTRIGGASRGRYDSMNLADHVGDDPASVARNRAWLRGELALPAEPSWLTQVHGAGVVTAGRDAGPRQADGAVTRDTGVVCAVLTADCLPVLFCDTAGEVVAAAHAGWRGLAAGVLEATVRRMGVSPASVLAWLGPAIGPDRFEVGEEVREAFLARDPGHGRAFRATDRGRWLADIVVLARQALGALGVDRVYGGGWCTYGDVRRFYSYRRDGVTGRMASLVWKQH